MTSNSEFMTYAQAIEQLKAVRKEIDELTSVHGLGYRVNKVQDIISKITPQSDAHELSEKQDSAIDALALSLDREGGWAKSADTLGKAKKGRTPIRVREAAQELQHAISPVSRDINDFIGVLEELQKASD